MTASKGHLDNHSSHLANSMPFKRAAMTDRQNFPLQGYKMVHFDSCK